MTRLLSFNYIYLLPLLVSAIFSLKAFRLKWPIPFRIFSVFLLTTLGVETFAIAWKFGLCHTAYWHYSRNNLWIYDAFVSIGELFLLAYFHGVIRNQTVRKLIRWSIAPILLFGIVDYIYIQSPYMINNYTFVLTNSITIFLLLVFFNQVLRQKEIIRLDRSTEIWIAMGCFLYYSGTLPLFIFLNYLNREQPKLAESYFHINIALDFVMYTFFSISFLCKPHFLK
jgi:hypothetical protein